MEENTNQWKQTRTGYRSKTVKGNGFTVIIHRPDLQPEVYQRREKEVLRALSTMRGGVAV